MNRQQRRMQERKEKKKNRVPEQKFEMNMDMIQPWSTFVMRTKFYLDVCFFLSMTNWIDEQALLILLEV